MLDEGSIDKVAYANVSSNGVGRGGPPGIVGMEGTIAESAGKVHLYRNDSEAWTDCPVEGKRGVFPRASFTWPSA